MLLLSVCAVGSMFIGTAEAAQQGAGVFERLNREIHGSVSSETVTPVLCSVTTYFVLLSPVASYHKFKPPADYFNGPGRAHWTGIWHAFWGKSNLKGDLPLRL
jgi:hypothetical protein